MSKWGLIQKHSLAYLGDNWKDCYIEMRAIPYKKVSSFLKIDASSIQENPEEYLKQEEDLVKLLKDNFVSGKLFDGKDVVDMKKGDIDDMPANVMTDLVGFLFQGSANQSKK